jgi:hypothetical protein
MPIQTYYTLQDAKGDKSTVIVPIPDGTDFDDIIEFVQEMADLLDPLTNGTLVDAGFTMSVAFTPWAVASAIADVQEKARFVFRTVGGFVKSLSLPTILEDIFLAGSKDVDTSDPDVAAFVTAMVDGLTLTSTNTIEPVDSRDEDLTDLNSAVEAWGRSRG